MSCDVSQWPQIVSSGISTLTGAFIAGYVALRVSKRNHEYSEAREEKAAAVKLQNEKQASEEKRVREHHFIATELIFMLERFAEQCARVATDDGEPNRERQHEYEPVTALPELNLSAISGDWRVLKPLHMFRIRELPVLQDEADRAVEAEWENFDPPLHTPYFKERQYQYARMGIRAVILAMRLRKEAALPGTRLADHEWSAVPLMRSVWRRERKWRAAEAIRIREWQGPVPQVNHERDETHL